MIDHGLRADVRTGPLCGVRIVDLTTVVFGPLASQILADYGADVIKVEAPEGDSTRHTGPAAERGMSALFLGSNRGKRSIVLDLKNEDGRAAMQSLIGGADVFMHSMRPQKLAAIGLEPASVMAANPRLVYAALLGFASGGSYSGRPAYDDIIQGMSGLASLMQRQTGEVRYLPTIAADKTCAQTAAHAILAALFARERTGGGALVEIPMFESMVAFNLVEHFYGQHFDPALAPPGYPRVLTPWRRPYPTTDGYICMVPYTDLHWKRFFEEVGRPDMALDPKFAGIASRTTHIRELLEFASGHIANATTAHWIAVCDRLEIPAAPVADLDALINDRHLNETGFFTRIEDSGMGSLRFPGVPVSFDGVRPETKMAPRLGEHTREILLEAGLNSLAIDALVEARVARQGVGSKAKTP
jgi:crotonobetainyl-CoA:carnitine CoA-transferase CaiB-like acyl-CoA transferase